ncbi:hypothetical protein CLU79DRAFT_6476 [Phycomyces nitens]|nr:hypothetical protein CLU79DRAFT_6476 [Phycomyces nitens]
MRSRLCILWYMAIWTAFRATLFTVLLEACRLVSNLCELLLLMIFNKIYLFTYIHRNTI